MGPTGPSVLLAEQIQCTVRVIHTREGLVIARHVNALLSRG